MRRNQYGSNAGCSEFIQQSHELLLKGFRGPSGCQSFVLTKADQRQRRFLEGETIDKDDVRLGEDASVGGSRLEGVRIDAFRHAEGAVGYGLVIAGHRLRGRPSLGPAFALLLQRQCEGRRFALGQRDNNRIGEPARPQCRKRGLTRRGWAWAGGPAAP